MKQNEGISVCLHEDKVVQLLFPFMLCVIYCWHPAQREELRGGPNLAFACVCICLRGSKTTHIRTNSLKTYISAKIPETANRFVKLTGYATRDAESHSAVLFSREGLSCRKQTASSSHLEEDSVWQCVCSSRANNTGFSPERQALMKGPTLLPGGSCSDYYPSTSFVKNEAFSINITDLWIYFLFKQKRDNPFCSCWWLIVLQLQTSISGWTNDAYLLDIALGCFCQSRYKRAF